MKQKNAKWVKMSYEFNSQTTGVHRTAENLKAQWESLKKITKKAASSARQSLLQTGGGPAKPQVNDPMQNKIMGLISTPAVGLFHKFDNDNIAITIGEETTENGPSQGEPTLAKVSVSDPSLLPTISSHLLPGISVESENMDFMPEISQDWGDYTTEMLQTPVSSSLRFHKKEASVCPLPDEDIVNKTPKLKAKPWTSKRRPTHPASCSSAMEELQKKKIKALEMQMQFAEAEREETKKMFEINYEKQNEILIQNKMKIKLLRKQVINEKRTNKENNN